MMNTNNSSKSKPLANFRRWLADHISPESRERRNRLERAANTDALTKLANHSAFMQAALTATEDENTAFVIFDINNLGAANKLLGHQLGDTIIFHAGFVLQKCAQRYGFGERTFRTGGDEFVALVPTQLAERLINDVENTFGTREIKNAAGEQLYVSISGSWGTRYGNCDRNLSERKNLAKQRDKTERPRGFRIVMNRANP
jgi:diguanylate cyclase (GGDEF)-like protein